MTTTPWETMAQRLITRGYKGLHRRNYLVQVYNDDNDAALASTDEAKARLSGVRWARWGEQGALPRSVLYQLLTLWPAQGNLCDGSGPKQGAGNTELGPAHPDSCYAVDIGITFAGFSQLGTHHQMLDLFRQKAPAFAEGAFLRASRWLGDSGPSDPERWTTRYRKDQTHVVLIVHAAGDPGNTGIQAFESSMWRRLGPPDAAPGLLTGHWVEQSSVLDDPREVHFGYIDGLSTPQYLSSRSNTAAREPSPFNVHALGELLLGHARNDGSNPWVMPGARAQMSGNADLRPEPETIAYREFFRDGSFGALRNMYQDVAAFEGFVDCQARLLQGCDERNDIEYTKGWIKAKLMGRWPNGAPVGYTPMPADREHREARRKVRIEARYPANGRDKEPDNNFSYKQDLDGFKCPFGAHIRRMNPRDDPVVPALRRPLLRRGLPYGAKYSAQLDNAKAERGLLGLFFCASLEEQFEHVLGNWANNNPMGIPHTHAGRDPIIGNQDPLSNVFDIPVDPQGRDPEFNFEDKPGGPIRLQGLGSFVATRGTCYAFFPNVDALAQIASGALHPLRRFR